MNLITLGACIFVGKLIENKAKSGSFIQISIGASDVLLDGMWLLYGWQQIRCLQGTSDINITNSIFETSRKGSIYSSSSVRNRVIGCTFWKNSADFSNPSDRGYAINLTKDGVYSFGSSNWSIVGNYFAENFIFHLNLRSCLSFWVIIFKS